MRAWSRRSGNPAVRIWLVRVKPSSPDPNSRDYENNGHQGEKSVCAPDCLAKPQETRPEECYLRTKQKTAYGKGGCSFKVQPGILKYGQAQALAAYPEAGHGGPLASNSFCALLDPKIAPPSGKAKSRRCDSRFDSANEAGQFLVGSATHSR
jgi:hypothetical protein